MERIRRMMNGLENHKEVIYLIARNLSLFYIVVFIANLTGLSPVDLFIDMNNAFLITLVADFIALILYMNCEKNTHMATNLIKYSFMFLFLVCALLYSDIEHFYEFQRILARYSWQLCSLTIMLGAITSWRYKDKENMSKWGIAESEIGNTLKKHLLEKLPRIKKVSVFGNVVKWMRKQGWPYYIALLLVFYLFFAIRVPYMGYSFLGVQHSSKYSTYLPNLINMYENQNPFLNQNFAYVSLFNNEPNPVLKAFSGPPIFAWGFLPFMFLTEYVPLEILIRSLLTGMGIILLLLIYLFLEKIFDKKIALIGTSLIAANQLFQLVTYITIMDFPALIFMFLAFDLFLYGKKELSYIFCGLSALAKYSFLLITFPALVMLILTVEKDKFYNLAKLGFFTALPIILFDFLIRPIPSMSFPDGVARLALMPVIFYITYKFIKKKDDFFAGLIKKVDKKIIYALIILLPLVLMLVLQSKISFYSSEFLTDQYLIFNWAMYNGLFLSVKDMIPDFIYYMFPLGLIIALLHEKSRRVSIPFLLAGLTYLIIASKAIFCHVYYRHVFVIIPIIFFCYIFYLVDTTNRNRILKILFVGVILILTIIPSYNNSLIMLDREMDGTIEMSEYIKQNNLADGNKFLKTKGEASVFVTYNGIKGGVLPSRGTVLDSLRDDINSKGFVDAFNQYNIKYYISLGEGEFGKISYFLFVNETSETTEIASSRTRVILDRIGQKEYYQEDISELSKKYDISKYFELEKRFGEWYLYKIVEKP